MDQTSDTFYADDTTRVKGRGRQIAHCCYQSQPTPLAPHRGPCSWTHGNPNMTRTPLPETCARGPVSVHIVSFVKLVHSLWPASFHPAHWCIFKFPSWACFANWWLYFASHWYPLIITDHYVYLIKFFFLTPPPKKKIFQGSVQQWINNTSYKPWGDWVSLSRGRQIRQEVWTKKEWAEFIGLSGRAVQHRQRTNVHVPEFNLEMHRSESEFLVRFRSRLVYSVLVFCVDGS